MRSHVTRGNLASSHKTAKDYATPYDEVREP
jgi:hypothetical protein